MFASRASSSALGKLQDEDLDLPAVTEEKSETQETWGRAGDLRICWPYGPRCIDISNPHNPGYIMSAI